MKFLRQIVIVSAILAVPLAAQNRPAATLDFPEATAAQQVILNMIEFGMTPQEAVEAPRFQAEAFYSSFAMHESVPGKLNLESRIPKATADKLGTLGHAVTVTGAWSNASAPIVIRIGDGVLERRSRPPARAFRQWRLACDS
jgi:hypothetical protein